MTIKTDRPTAVSEYLKRLDTSHLDGGSSAFENICRDICDGELTGTNLQFTMLWERLVQEQRGMRNLRAYSSGRKAVKHVFQEKDRVAPNPPQIEPALSVVRLYKRS